jgi:hypothetical protein
MRRKLSRKKLQKRRRTRRRQLGGKQLKFAVLAIFKNESMSIREWVEHYKWQGVDEILMLDNDSNDGGADLVRGIPGVTIIDAKEQHVQKKNYDTFGYPWLKAHHVDILAVLDIDEYMYGKGGKNLKQHLVEIFTAPDRPSQVSCNWVMFGSSDHVKQPPSVRKGFTWKKKEPQINCKSAVWFKDLKNDTSLMAHTHEVTGKTIHNPPGLQLNHYIIQSKEYYETVKMTRGAPERPDNVRDWKYFEGNDVKEVEDTELKDMVEKAGQ